MKNRFLFLTTLIVLFCSFSKPRVFKMSNSLTVKSIPEDKILSLYKIFTTNNSSIPKLSCFSKAIKGYSKLKAQGKIKKETLKIIDFSLSSKSKRI